MSNDFSPNIQLSLSSTKSSKTNVHITRIAPLAIPTISSSSATSLTPTDNRNFLLQTQKPRKITSNSDNTSHKSFRKTIVPEHRKQHFPIRRCKSTLSSVSRASKTTTTSGHTSWSNNTKTSLQRRVSSLGIRSTSACSDISETALLYLSNTRTDYTPMPGLDPIGFSHLPNQIYQKLVRKGFDFNILLVGESGLGKSTLINSLFCADIYTPQFPGPTKRIDQTVKVEKHDLLMEENGVKLRLGIIDTPGFGDHINNEDAWRPIEDYIELQYKTFLQEECKVNRDFGLQDSRVHACLYFIPPRVHGLRKIDLEFLQRLHDKVTIIPIIAKSDSLTVDERKKMKGVVRRQLEDNKIFAYYSRVGETIFETYIFEKIDC